MVNANVNAHDAGSNVSLSDLTDALSDDDEEPLRRPMIIPRVWSGRALFSLVRGK